MTSLRSVFRELAEDAPAVRVPPDLYENARRRRKRRTRAAVAAVLVLAALVVTGLIVRPHHPAERFGGDSAGLPTHLVDAPWYTDTVGHSPVGPAAVVFSLGESNPQSDPEDFDLAWWRGGHTVSSSTVVARDRDAYRIVRAGYYTGTELSPDGRHLISEGHVLDLATGDERHRLRPAPLDPSWAPDGQTPPSAGNSLYGRWSADGTWIVAADEDRTMIFSWPSGRVERLVRHPGQRPVDQDLALSPDGATLAVQSNDLFRVYGADGTLRWSRDATSSQLRPAGRAAWRPDGRLFVFERSDASCDACGWQVGTWRLAAVDGTTGTPVAAPDYPAIRTAMNVDVVTWRGDVAYALVSYTNGRRDADVEVERTELVRLVPGAAAPERVLAGPPGTLELGVATDLVGAVRPVGPPDFGYNAGEAWGKGVSWAFCPVLVLVIVAVVIWRRRRAKRWG
jgi:hypothetical protein